MTHTLFDKETGAILWCYDGPDGTEKQQAEVFGAGLARGEWSGEAYFVDPASGRPQRRKTQPVAVDVEAGKATLRRLPVPAKLAIENLLEPTEVADGTAEIAVAEPTRLKVRVDAGPRFVPFEREVDVP